MLQHHPHRTLADLRRELVRRLARHRSSRSGVGASDKPRALHRPRGPADSAPAVNEWGILARRGTVGMARGARNRLNRRAAHPPPAPPEPVGNCRASSDTRWPYARHVVTDQRGACPMKAPDTGVVPIRLAGGGADVGHLEVCRLADDARAQISLYDPSRDGEGDPAAGRCAVRKVSLASSCGGGVRLWVLPMKANLLGQRGLETTLMMAEPRSP